MVALFVEGAILDFRTWFLISLISPPLTMMLSNTSHSLHTHWVHTVIPYVQCVKLYQVLYTTLPTEPPLVVRPLYFVSHQSTTVQISIRASLIPNDSISLLALIQVQAGRNVESKISTCPNPSALYFCSTTNGLP